MKHFERLTIEKKQNILDSAMRVFGLFGYKKASAMDIAKGAKISKGMVFHYFGSKKELYSYLVEWAYKVMTEEFEKITDKSNGDFFDKIESTTQAKMRILNRYPHLLSFLTSVYLERDREVEEVVFSLLKRSEGVASNIVIDENATKKFKNGIKPEMVLNILTKFTEGYISSNLEKNIDIAKMLSEFEYCLSLMKNNFYKEEYLK